MKTSSVPESYLEADLGAHQRRGLLSVMFRITFGCLERNDPPPKTFKQMPTYYAKDIVLMRNVLIRTVSLAHEIHKP